MKAEHVYLNGTILPRSEAKISAADRGFLYGDGFFETARIVAGTPFRLGQHVERLNRSCLEAKWDREMDGERIEEAVAALVRRNEVAEGYLRITASRGPHRGELMALEALEPTLLVEARPMELPPLDAPPPYTLIRSPYRLNERSPLVRHKATSYQANLLALAEGRRRGADEVYFLNSQGHLTEGAITNLFFVRSGKVCTPDVECGLLPGITRGVVMELCVRHAVPWETGHYEEEELGLADEVFCTNSLRGIVPVEAIVEVREHFAERPLTTRLQRLYAALVRAECADAGEAGGRRSAHP